MSKYIPGVADVIDDADFFRQLSEEEALPLVDAFDGFGTYEYHGDVGCHSIKVLELENDYFVLDVTNAGNIPVNPTGRYALKDGDGASVTLKLNNVNRGEKGRLFATYQITTFDKD